MKTVKEWFESVQDDDLKNQLLKEMQNDWWKVGSFHKAMLFGIKEPTSIIWNHIYLMARCNKIELLN